MKVLILGGTGMAGHTISIYFKESGHDVTVFSRVKIDYCKNINGDITDFDNIRSIIEIGEFDAIINAVGILNQEAEENKARAVLINTYFPHFLSDVTKKMNTKVIHMSTDCVFSGKSGAYSETSTRDGSTFYDRTKALGELDNNKDLTFRNSIIGPDIDKNGIGLFNWFMKQDVQISGFTKAIWTGVTTLTLAKAIEQAINQDLKGLYHLVNNQNISKFELLKLFNNCFKEDKIEILQNDNISINKSLVNNRNDFLFKVPSYENMIYEMKEWIVNHKTFYPHYFIKEKMS